MGASVVVWYLLISGSNSAVVIPTPFQSEAKCLAVAAKISRSLKEGGISNKWGYCIAVDPRP